MNFKILLGLISIFGISFLVSGCGNQKIIQNEIGNFSEIKKTKTEVSDLQPTEPQKEIRIAFLGDLMFDRYIRQAISKKDEDFVFGNLKDFLLKNDLVVGNLEGPITDNSSISVNSAFGARENYIFTFDKNILETLKKYNVTLLNIGNNHISNFGQSGIESTKKYLKEAGLNYIGDVQDENGNYYIKNINGLKIAFVGYNQFSKNAWQGTLADIEKVKSNSDLIIVYAHWDKEYQDAPMEATKKIARSFIDAGADLIIGSHPHVIQNKEKYQGKMIYYSLGNFIFDQYFDARTQKGLAVVAVINPLTKEIKFEEKTVSLERTGQTLLK